MFSQRVDIEETHTFNPFDLEKPLKGYPFSGDLISRRWWEPQWLWNRRKEYARGQSQYRAELDLDFKRQVREMFRYHLDHDS